MDDQRREIARKYMLPERPFLHGMASAFDMFGALSHGKREQLLANLQEESDRPGRDIMGSAWRSVGESLLFAMETYEKAAGESNRR